MDQFYSSNRLPWAAIQEIQAVCAPMPSGHGLSHLKDAEDISAPGSGMPKEMCRAEKAGADPCSARETGHSSSFKSNYWLMKNATGPKPATSGTPSFNLLALRANTSITSRAGNPTPNKMIMKMSQIVLRFALSLFLTGLVALTLQGHSCNNPPQLGNGEAELGETGDVTFPGIAQYPTRLTIDGEVIDPAYCAQANVSAPSPINDYTVIDPATLTAGDFNNPSYIVWSVGAINDNTGTPATWSYTGTNSSQWISGFCYASVSAPFEAQISQLCDGDSPNEATIIFASDQPAL